MIDLHSHSSCSDGTLSPTELVNLAINTGLSAVALTDHDTVDGLPEAFQHAAALRDAHPEDPAYDLELIPGIEFSTIYKGKDIHIVGLYFDWQNEEFLSQVREFSDARDNRNRKMCARLQADGIEVPYEDLINSFPAGTSITRANFARYMLDHGITYSMKEAFDRYIGDDCKYFVPREKITPAKAVQFLRQFHGIPILAHPLQYHFSAAELEELVSELTALGLMGIETVYNNHTPQDTADLTRLANKYGLLPSGGSDFHGENKPGLKLGTGYGHLYVPDHFLTDLKHRLHGISGSSKLFVTDFDGTLGTTEKTVSPATRDALEHWTGAGNLFALSSGRAFKDVRNLKDRLKLDYPGSYLIAGNGSQVYDCSRGELILDLRIDKALVPEVYALADEVGVYVQTYDDEHILLREKTTPELEFYQKSVKLPVLSDPDLLKHLKTDPGKVLAISLNEPEKLEALRQEILKRYPGVLDAFQSSPYLLEIVSVHAGKGKALRWLCRYLGITAENSIAAGDAPNDISMIRAAGLGVVMCNGAAQHPAMQKLVECGDAVMSAQDNDHDGLLPYLKI